MLAIVSEVFRHQLIIVHFDAVTLFEIRDELEDARRVDDPRLEQGVIAASFLSSPNRNLSAMN